MSKDILIVAHFTDDLDKKENGRFNYIAHLLSNMKVNVELVTSAFSHDKKTNRDKNNVDVKYKVTFIPEPTYRKNVSLKRFYSHFIMARNLKRYLRHRKKPDVIYCAIPSLDVAMVTAKYAEKNRIKLIIDIQDCWPEAFKMVFDIPIFSDLLFYHMKKKAEFVYRAANDIIAVSNTYLNRALKVNKKYENAVSVFLGTELEKVDTYNNLNTDKPIEEVWLAYVGTLGHSYDIEMVIDSLEILNTSGINNVKFIVIGDGPLKQKFENYAKYQNVWALFTGRLDYKTMMEFLLSCDIAINPIKTGSAGSIINKVGDYAAAGLPVINTQECAEYRDLIDKYQAGLNCNNGDPIDVAKSIATLVRNEELRKKMGCNNRRLANEKFDRKETYKSIIDLLLIN